MTQGKETVTTYKTRIDTKHQRGTKWKIYGRKSGCKNAENSLKKRTFNMAI